MICIRIDRARAKGAGLGWHFRQEIPRGFEFRQKNSRRKSAVRADGKHTTLTKIESNVVVKPIVQTVAKIAKALGVPMEDLVK